MSVRPSLETKTDQKLISKIKLKAIFSLGVVIISSDMISISAFFAGDEGFSSSFENILYIARAEVFINFKFDLRGNDGSGYFDIDMFYMFGDFSNSIYARAGFGINFFGYYDVC